MTTSDGIASVGADILASLADVPSVWGGGRPAAVAGPGTVARVD